jgi:hypothetical protein
MKNPSTRTCDLLEVYELELKEYDRDKTRVWEMTDPKPYFSGLPGGKVIYHKSEIKEAKKQLNKVQERVEILKEELNKRPVAEIKAAQEMAKKNKEEEEKKTSRKSDINYIPTENT